MALISRFSRSVNPHAWVISLALVLVLGSAQVVAAAEELPREAALPLTLANKAAAAAQEKCKQDGYRVSVAGGDGGRGRAGRSSGRRLCPGRAGQQRRGAEGAAPRQQIRRPSS